MCSPGHRFGPTIRIELGENGGDVKLGGVEGDSQPTCDRLIPLNYSSRECRMKLDKEVPGCFGDKDLVFAGQPLNEGRAFGWLNSLRKREIGWQAASTQIAEYLKSRNASDARIKEQLDRASKYLRPWLRD